MLRTRQVLVLLLADDLVARERSEHRDFEVEENDHAFTSIALTNCVSTFRFLSLGTYKVKRLSHY